MPILTEIFSPKVIAAPLPKDCILTAFSKPFISTLPSELRGMPSFLSTASALGCSPSPSSMPRILNISDIISAEAEPAPTLSIRSLIFSLLSASAFSGEISPITMQSLLYTSSSAAFNSSKSSFVLTRTPTKLLSPLSSSLP